MSRHQPSWCKNWLLENCCTENFLPTVNIAFRCSAVDGETFVVKAFAFSFYFKFSLLLSVIIYIFVGKYLEYLI